MKQSPRDVQKGRVYAAERAVRDLADFHEPTFASTAEAQAYINRVTEARWFQARWGRMHVNVIGGHGNNAGYRDRIMISAWGRRPTVLLHELAHVLASDGDVQAHGPEFAACVLALLANFLGADVGALFRDSYRTHRVRYRSGTAAVPAPNPGRVRTKAAAREHQRAVAARPVYRSERKETAAVLRRLIAAGEFGPVGRKTRTYAGQIARQLEA